MTKQKLRIVLIAAAVLLLAAGLIATLLRLFKPAQTRLVRVEEAPVAQVKPPTTVAKAPATTPAPPTPWRSTAASGTFVDLVGVANHPAQNGVWWKPDGTLQPTSAPTRPPQQEMPWTQPGTRAYELFVRSSSSMISPKPAKPGQLFYRAAGVMGERQLQEVVVAVPEEWERMDFGIGMQALSRKALSVMNVAGPALRDGHVHHFGGKGTLQVSGLKEVDGLAETTLDYAPGPEGSVFKNQWISKWVYTRKGGQVWGRVPEQKNRPDGGFAARWTFAAAPDEIKSLRCQVEPYEYAEYRNVSLRAGKPTAVTVVDLAGAEMEAAPKAAATEPAGSAPGRREGFRAASEPAASAPAGR